MEATQGPGAPQSCLWPLRVSPTPPTVSRAGSLGGLEGRLSVEGKAGTVPASRGVSTQKPTPHQHEGEFPPSLLFPRGWLPFSCRSAASRHEDNAVAHNDKNSQCPGMTSTWRASPLCATAEHFWKLLLARGWLPPPPGPRAQRGSALSALLAALPRAQVSQKAQWKRRRKSISQWKTEALKSYGSQVHPRRR